MRVMHLAGLALLTWCLHLLAPLRPACTALATLDQDDPAPMALLLAGLALLAWACACWLLLLAALSVAARLPGPVGRTFLHLARALAPAGMRGVLGLALSTTLLSASPAQAAPVPTPPPAAGGAALDWPSEGTPAPSAAPLALRPVRPLVGPQPPLSKPASPSPKRAASDAVVVRAGDSLWSIAAGALGEQASDRAVAASWPRWWAANRSVVGDDPHLIHPRTVLHTPTPRRGEP